MSNFTIGSTHDTLSLLPISYFLVVTDSASQTSVQTSVQTSIRGRDWYGETASVSSRPSSSTQSEEFQKPPANVHMYDLLGLLRPAVRTHPLS